MHGLRYSFPAVLGPEREGVPTSTTHGDVARLVNGAADAQSVVWTQEGAVTRGASLVPLFPGVLEVASRDARMHEMLAMVDAVRSGNERVRSTVGHSFATRFLAE